METGLLRDALRVALRPLAWGRPEAPGRSGRAGDSQWSLLEQMSFGLTCYLPRIGESWVMDLVSLPFTV